MAILEVSNLKKIYTTRFGGNHGRVRLRKDDTFKYSRGT